MPNHNLHADRRLLEAEKVPRLGETQNNLAWEVKPVPASMMRPQSSWQQATEEMLRPSVIALLHMLLHPSVGHIVVVPLLHGPVRIVHCDPLRGWQTQPNFLLRHLRMQLAISELTLNMDLRRIHFATARG